MLQTPPARGRGSAGDAGGPVEERLFCIGVKAVARGFGCCDSGSAAAVEKEDRAGEGRKYRSSLTGGAALRAEGASMRGAERGELRPEAWSLITARRD